MDSLTASAVMAVLFLSCVYLEPASSAAIASSGVSYKSCSSNSIFSVRSLTVSPDPPKVGKPVTITVEIESSEVITGGQVQIQIAGLGVLSLLKPQPVTRDMCPLLPTGCPVMKGTTSMTVTQEIPSFVPAGKYQVEMKAQDNSGRTLLCADLTIQLTARRRMFF